MVSRQRTILAISFLPIVFFFLGFVAHCIYVAHFQIRGCSDAYRWSEVVKATEDIPAGTPLRKNQVTTQYVLKSSLPINPLEARDFDIYVGSLLDVNIEKGSVIRSSQFRVEVVADCHGC